MLHGFEGRRESVQRSRDGGGFDVGAKLLDGLTREVHFVESVGRVGRGSLHVAGRFRGRGVRAWLPQGRGARQEQRAEAQRREEDWKWSAVFHELPERRE